MKYSRYRNGVQSEMGRALLNKGTCPQFPASKEKERITYFKTLSVCLFASLIIDWRSKGIKQKLDKEPSERADNVESTPILGTNWKPSKEFISARRIRGKFRSEATLNRESKIGRSAMKEGRKERISTVLRKDLQMDRRGTRYLSRQNQAGSLQEPESLCRKAEKVKENQEDLLRHCQFDFFCTH